MAQPYAARAAMAKQAARLLEAELQNPPTLVQIAEAAGCSTFQLSRMFQEIIGMSIPEFLRKKRMAKATQLLRDTTLNVGVIASDVGYHSLSAFTRAFAREIGQTPDRYRTSIAPHRDTEG